MGKLENLRLNFCEFSLKIKLWNLIARPMFPMGALTMTP